MLGGKLRRKVCKERRQDGMLLVGGMLLDGMLRLGEELPRMLDVVLGGMLGEVLVLDVVLGEVLQLLLVDVGLVVVDEEC